VEINSELLWKGLCVMERHSTTSVVSIDKRNKGVPTGAGPERLTPVLDAVPRPQPGRADAPAVAPASARTHTLVLVGELTHRSAQTLELELERLYEEGVTAIILDLRQLDHVDPIGVAVIAFRCGLYQRRGVGFMLIPGSRRVQGAFERAGAGDLPFHVDEVAIRRLRVAGKRTVFARRR
jgi:anti-anti-sigma factor